MAVLATVDLLSTRRPPVLVACCVGSGAFIAVCAHMALNSAFWIVLAVPLAAAGPWPWRRGPGRGCRAAPGG